MTRWEAGQILIACNDKLCDKIEELKDNGYPELAEKLDPIELVSWQWQEFEAIGESEIEAQAVREAMLTGGPQALAHYQLWRLPFVAARHSARALARF